MNASKTTQSRTKLFVKNLPERATSDELAEVFSIVGPLRECWVVTEKGSDRCKGFAFVQYVLPADATRALSEMKGQRFMGNIIEAEYAKPKNYERPKVNIKVEDSEGEDGTTPKSEKRKRNKRGKGGSKTEQNHRVALWDLDTDRVEKKHIYKRVRKICTPVEVTFPLPHNSSAALLTVQKAVNAKKLEKKLDKHIFKGKTIRACVVEGKARVIVRNLAWKVGTAELAAPFTNIGVVVLSVQVPVKAGGKKCGFGFVQLVSVGDATRAIQELNASSIMGRVVALDFAIPKDEYQSLKPEAPHPTTIKQEDEKHQDEGSEYDSGEQDEYSNEQDEYSSDQDDGDQDDDDEEEEEEEGTYVTSEDEENIQQPKKKLRKEDPYINQTLFIRGLSFDTAEETLMNVFGVFGDIRSCAVCRDGFSGRGRGMAFVQFSKQADCDAVLAKHGVEGMTSKTSVRVEGGGMTIDGRHVIITRAVSRQQAKKLSGQVPKQRDKRNLYLLNEGVIKAGTPAAAGLSDEELERRARSLAEKRMQLNRSTNFFVSPTRLSVLNVPKNMKEKKLQALFIGQVKASNGGKFVDIKSCRIVKDSSRGGASRGFAFIEFSKEEDALLGLRTVNNNPKLIKGGRRLIVSFAVENVQALQLQKRRKDRLDRKRARTPITNKNKNQKKHNKIDNKTDGKTDKKKEMKKKEKKEKKKEEEEDNISGAESSVSKKKKNKMSREEVRKMKRKAKDQRRKQRKRDALHQSEEHHHTTPVTISTNKKKVVSADKKSTEEIQPSPSPVFKKKKRVRHKKNKEEREEQRHLDNSIAKYQQSLYNTNNSKKKKKTKKTTRWFESDE